MQRGQKGVAAVEFALCLPLLALLCLGVVDLARVYTLENQLKNAAREGANYAQTDPLSQKPSGTTVRRPQYDPIPRLLRGRNDQRDCCRHACRDWWMPNVQQPQPRYSPRLTSHGQRW